MARSRVVPDIQAREAVAIEGGEREWQTVRPRDGTIGAVKAGVMGDGDMVNGKD